jgi:trehalose 6-phosphate phosphatase
VLNPSGPADPAVTRGGLGTDTEEAPVLSRAVCDIGLASALGMIEDLSRTVVGIDFDGTLSPLTPHPRNARLDPAAAFELGRIAEAGAAVGVVTGRSVESLLEVAGAELAAIPNLVIEGMYGAERWSDGVLHTMRTPERIYSLRSKVSAVVRATMADSAVWIEDKRLSLAVHTRITTDPRAQQLALAGPLSGVAAEHDMELHLGKEVLEFRLRGINKATALDRLVDTTCRAVVYAGDDIGDVPAFASVRRWRDRTTLPGITIGVVADASSPIAGEADWEVRDTAGLTASLRALGC